MVEAALRAVDGRRAVSRRLQQAPLSYATAVVAIGKAAQAMVLGVADAQPDLIGDVLVITKQGHLDEPSLQSRGWQTVVGGHPLPDEGSLLAGSMLLDFIENTQGPLLFLISGGASALVEVPVDGVGLETVQQVNRWLLGSGLDIVAINAVRMALSQIKGGGLLRWVQERSLRVLAISDVPYNDPVVIGSGLLVPSPDLVQKVAGIRLPEWIADAVASGVAQRQSLPMSGPPVEIVADIERAKTAAARCARELGYAVMLHPEFVDGLAALAGHRLADVLLGASPGVHVWGGETVVDLPPMPGRGGRNQHLALAAAQRLAGCDRCWLLSVGTDGTDGVTEDAGALVDGRTLRRAEEEGLDAADALRKADSGTILAATGDLIHTGPTGTNVMDLMIGMKTE